MVEELIAAIGADKVYHETPDLIPYSRDTFTLRFSEEDTHLPDLIVLPTSIQEIVKIVEIAGRHSIPIIPKGGGTNRTGMLVPISGGIVLDTIRLNKLLRIDRMDMLVTVQAGITLQELELLLNKQGLTLGHEQGSQKVATVGGAISTASYSRKNQKYGNLWERIASMEVVLGTGIILRTSPRIPYTSSGIGIAGLFVGAEGTLGVISEVTLRVEVMPEKNLSLLGLFSDYSSAQTAADLIVSSGITFMGGSVWEDERGFSSIGFPDYHGAMLIGFEGSSGETEAAESLARSIIESSGRHIADTRIAKEHWDDFLMHWCGMRAEVGNEDVIVAYVPRLHEEEYFHRLLDEILPKYGLIPLPGSRRSYDFGRHVIFGTRFSIPQSDEGWDSYISAIGEISGMVSSLGGTIAACHGIGLLHRDHIFLELGKSYIDLYAGFKKIMDPKGIMNPGKKFPDADRHPPEQ